MAESAKQHIDRIRKTKFSIGGAYNPLTEDLHQALKNLSAELYSKDVHFLMELIQNAEDNEYPEGVDPSLEFILTYEDITATEAPATLLVFNNEKGFSEKNIESICSVGRSTKNGNRKRGYIGEKGIGFKSVFLITSQPYIFSNGYQICFNETPRNRNCNLGYIVPEWVEQHPSLVDIQRIYGFGSALPTTTIILPLKSDKVKPVKEQLSNVHPEVCCFQRSRASLLENTTKIKSALLTLSGFYYMWRQKFPVKDENRVGRRSEVEEFLITLAFPFGDRLALGNSSPPGIYAFLPTEMVTNFPFIIQGDFILASSREAILLDDIWNQGILRCVPSAFVNAFTSLMKKTDAFSFLPVKESNYEELNDVRESIMERVSAEGNAPSRL
ncbi:Histidine kinase/HSP90-like ATPase superfamily [Arabidopsis suecica]|uniref:Histidine kinase/HSP90-like ATPase superfamily n=1 Tax=Arabidopsis suecica TaxID=45249 RepID=A0A8T1ZUR4_ARASU|nr:Histidine kinase/HSP90-like ATPase superfamily [Arabidopsis suecica]